MEIGHPCVIPRFILHVLVFNSEYQFIVNNFNPLVLDGSGSPKSIFAALDSIDLYSRFFFFFKGKYLSDKNNLDWLKKNYDWIGA